MNIKQMLDELAKRDDLPDNTLGFVMQCAYKYSNNPSFGLTLHEATMIEALYFKLYLRGETK